MAEPNARDETDCKVGRLIESYGLDGMGETLERRWLGTDTRQRSLRRLADEFNMRLLRRELVRSDRSVLPGEVENLYRLLTDDDASSGERTQTERLLERDGVDVERLRSDFVSHQAVHTYLTEYRGVSLPDDETDQIEKGSETVQKLQEKLAAVTRRTLENLRETDRITIGQFTVLVNVSVACEECDTTLSVHDLLSNRGCACQAG